MNGNAKKLLIQNAATLIYIVIMIALFLFMSAMPRMGKQALIYSIVKGIIVMVLSVCLVTYHVIRKVIERRNDTNGIQKPSHEQDNSAVAEFERAFDSNRVSITFGVVIAVILVIFSLIGISSDVDDLKNGTVSVTLTHTQIQARTNTVRTNRASRFIRRPYDLKGQNGYKTVSFRVYSNDVSSDVRDIINEHSPNITVIYYPNSKTIEQIQIHLEDRTIVIPNGAAIQTNDGLTSSQSTTAADGTSSPQTEPAVTETVYVDVPLSEVELCGLTTGTDLSEAMKLLAGGGWRLPIPPLDDPNKYDEAEDEIRRMRGWELAVCIMLTSKETQLFVIADVDSGAVVDIYARKPQT